MMWAIIRDKYRYNITRTCLLCLLIEAGVRRRAGVVVSLTLACSLSSIAVTKMLSYGETFDKMTKFRYGIGGTMLIGLISDTHIPEVTHNIPTQVKEIFKDVDLILHAGDVYIPSVLHELEHLAPVLAAKGDDDYPDTMNDKRVKENQVLTVEGVTIWLKHILWWWPNEPKKEIDPADPQYEKPPDVLVHGHTHRATIENRGGTLLINPGSATFPYYRHELGTVALLTVSSGKAEAQIIQLQ